MTLAATRHRLYLAALQSAKMKQQLRPPSAFDATSESMHGWYSCSQAPRRWCSSSRRSASWCARAGAGCGCAAGGCAAGARGTRGARARPRPPLPRPRRPAVRPGATPPAGVTSRRRVPARGHGAGQGERSEIHPWQPPWPTPVWSMAGGHTAPRPGNLRSGRKRKVRHRGAGDQEQSARRMGYCLRRPQHTPISPSGWVQTDSRDGSFSPVDAFCDDAVGMR